MKCVSLAPSHLYRPFQVVCLREAERHLRLHCEELELQAGEQEAVLREMEVAMQRLALDADRRLTQQHQDHQNNIQLLLQKLKGEEIRQSRLNVKPFALYMIFAQKLNEHCCFIYCCLTVLVCV